MKKHSSKISVIIPAFNAEKHISEALDSVLGQSCPGDQVLVIDDQSTDQTVKLVEKFPSVRLLKQPHRGCADARNHGIRVSDGEFLAFLDADDIWAAEKLELQMNYLLEHPSCAAVFSMVQNFISPELSQKERSKLVCAPSALVGIHAGAMLIRRKSFFDIGWFDTELITHFVSWWSKFNANRLLSHVLPEVLMYRRLHTSNTMRTHKQQGYREYLQLARNEINRKLKNGAGNDPPGMQKI